MAGTGQKWKSLGVCEDDLSMWSWRAGSFWVKSMEMMEWLLDYDYVRRGGREDMRGYTWHEYGLSARFRPLRVYGSPYTGCLLGLVLCSHGQGMTSGKRSANVEISPFQ